MVSGDSWWILVSFCSIFVGFGESLVLLFTGAVGRGKRCSPVPLVAVISPIKVRSSEIKWDQVRSKSDQSEIK